MKQISLFLIAILSVFQTVSAQRNTVVLYRSSDKKVNKFLVRAFFGVTAADTLPAANSVYYTANDLSVLAVKTRIENYAGWPKASLKITVIKDDTTYVKVKIKKDAFGNPAISLEVTPAIVARQELALIPNTRIMSDRVPVINESGKKIPDFSGSGFLISSRGYIITNYHVVNRGTDFRIRNVNGRKDTSYAATLLLKDENNDLAILKLKDDNIKLDSIPFSIKNSIADLGERIAIFGYPLTTSMGDDVKLTNGIISSVNGYKGEINAYQLSAPVQPGNSGGPVFDEKGNLVAVVNAKHTLAENATYAIKSSYLLNMLQNLPEIGLEKSSAELWKLSVTEQVKLLQKLVYIIEVN